MLKVNFIDRNFEAFDVVDLLKYLEDYSKAHYPEVLFKIRDLEPEELEDYSSIQLQRVLDNLLLEV